MESHRENAPAVAKGGNGMRLRAALSYAAGTAMVVAALMRDDLGSAAWILFGAAVFFLIPPLPRHKATWKLRRE